MVRSLLQGCRLHTVCESARCPNRHGCWGRGTATFLLLGTRCTRRCSFCAVASGLPLPPDPDEPRRIADAAAGMKLRHVVITSVTRDDLDDGGASLFVETIHEVRARLPGATVEVLPSDLRGNTRDVERILCAGPDVFNHNLETVRRLQRVTRPQASYERSLAVLRQAAQHPAHLLVKSGLMAGLGETDEELYEAMHDLYAAGCRLLTLGQYLAPDSKGYAQMDRFVPPSRFDAYAAKARRMGFLAVASGPLVRSSFQAGEMLRAARKAYRPMTNDEAPES